MMKLRYVLAFGLILFFLGLALVLNSTDDSEAREAGYQPGDCSDAYSELVETNVPMQIAGCIMVLIGGIVSVGCLISGGIKVV